MMQMTIDGFMAMNPGHLEAQGINRLSIRWDDGEQMELDLYQGIDPLAAVARKYGPRALLDLQTALFLQFMNWDDDPGRGFPWWANEHARLQGGETKGYRELFKMIDRLAGSKLTAHYEDGETMVSPILALNREQTDKRGNIYAAYMSIHPALSRGVFGEDKRKDPTVPEQTDTLTQARADLRSRLDDGVTCPCCDQYAKIYRRPLNANMSMFLCSLVKISRDRVAGGYPPWVSWRRIDHTSRDYSYARHWGLMVERPPDSTRARSSGFWKPTDKGIQFVMNQIRVPKRVHLYNNEVIGWDEETTCIVEAMGKNFDYAELMGGA